MKAGLALGATDEVIREAKEAEDLGFDYVTSGEHLFFHGPVPNAFVSLAAAAGATRRVRLVSSISLAPLYPPALFAKMVASLDVVSAGRFEVGIGAGGEYPAEFEAVDVDPAGRFRAIDETVEVCRRLFAGGAVDHDSEHAHLRGVTLEPLPVQRPGPPIWMAGRKAGALQRVGRLADVWLPYMVTPARLGEGLEQVRNAARDAEREPDSVAAAVFAWTCTDPDGDWARRTGVDMVSRIYAQDFGPLADRYLFLGDPGQVAARLGEFAGAGADRVVFSVAAPGADRQRVVRTLAEQVLPAVANLQRGARPRGESLGFDHDR